MKAIYLSIILGLWGVGCVVLIGWVALLISGAFKLKQLQAKERPRHYPWGVS